MTPERARMRACLYYGARIRKLDSLMDRWQTLGVENGVLADAQSALDNARRYETEDPEPYFETGSLEEIVEWAR